MSTKADELKLYYGKDYEINGHIRIHQPTIGEILDYGEGEYFAMAKTLTSTPSDMKSLLFDKKIDYEALEDFDLFCMLARGFSQEQTSIIFGSLDFTKFKKVLVDGEDRPVLYNPDGYLRKIHGFKARIEKAGNERTKRTLIELDRMDREAAKREGYHSFLVPLISSLTNIPGFKYNSREVRDIGIYQFMDSVQRVNLIKATDNLYHGIYAGTIDSGKIKSKDLDWMRGL